jgi:hypothetical protein
MRRQAWMLFVLALGRMAAAGEADVTRGPPPDPARGEAFDGRDSHSTPGTDAALFVPRLTLLPMRLLFIALEPPTRAGIEFDQRHHVSQKLYDAITSRDGLIGVRPEIHYSLDFEPVFGLRFYHDRLMGYTTSFTMIGAGGPGVAHGEVLGRPTAATSPVQFTFGAIYDRRSDRLFAGIDNTVPFATSPSKSRSSDW